MTTEPIPPYAWVAWLSQHDAQLIALSLMAAVEDPSCTRETLTTIVDGWRANALKALTAEDWTATVDKYLEVTVDARLYVFQDRSQPVGGEGDDDEE